MLRGGVTLSGSYRFVSLTLKGIERRLDGIYEPEDHDGPVYIVEFQAQPVPSAWFNLLTKIGLYGETHPGRAVRGVLIFLRAGDDPGLLPGAGPPLCSVAYLDDVLPRWGTSPYAHAWGLASPPSTPDWPRRRIIMAYQRTC